MKIFLSYRRADSAPWAGRLGDALVSRYGSGNVFQDVVTIRPGERYADVMNAAVADADVVLAVIGPGWLLPTDAGPPRLADPQDYVRRELVAAIAHARLVIPVLVGGAALPTVDQLPEDLRPLVARQAVVLEDEDWSADVDRLFAALSPDAVARRPRRRAATLAAAGAVVVLVVAGVLAWQFLGSAAGGGASTSVQSGSTSPAAAADTACATPAGQGWTSIGTSPPTTSTGDWRFTATGGGYRPLDAGGWSVVLALHAELVATQSDYLYPDTYRLLSGGQTVAARCFSYLGVNRLDPGMATDVLVGFTVDAEPTDAKILTIDTYGQHYQVEIA